MRAGEDLGAVLGEQGLVGGDDVLAAVDRLEHEDARVGLPADELDHDVDVGPRHDFVRPRYKVDAVERYGALFREVARRGDLDHDVAPGAAADLLAIAAQHLDGAAADRAEAEQADLDGLHVMFRPSFLSKWNDVIVIPSRK